VLIPGGRYPWCLGHMSVLPAKVAGVPRTIACTPPIQGELPAATVAHAPGGGRDLPAGGSQPWALWRSHADHPAGGYAIGPATLRAEAKRQLFGRGGIDLLADRPRFWWWPTRRGCQMCASICWGRPSTVPIRRHAYLAERKAGSREQAEVSATADMPTADLRGV